MRKARCVRCGRVTAVAGFSERYEGEALCQDCLAERNREEKVFEEVVERVVGHE